MIIMIYHFRPFLHVANNGSSITLDKKSSKQICMASTRQQISKVTSIKHKDSMDSICTKSRDPLQPSGVIRNHCDIFNFDMTAKGFNFAHLNVQGLCGQSMSKF